MKEAKKRKARPHLQRLSVVTLVTMMVMALGMKYPEREEKARTAEAPSSWKEPSTPTAKAAF